MAHIIFLGEHCLLNKSLATSPPSQANGMDGGNILYPQAIKLKDSDILWTSDYDSRSEGLPLPLSVLSYGSESSTQKFPSTKFILFLMIQTLLLDVVGLNSDQHLYRQK